MSNVYNKRHGNAPMDAVYVGRGSQWGNPFKIGQHGTREEVIAKFKAEILPKLDVTFLRNKDLVCWCAPLACHADLLLEKANEWMCYPERIDK
jgi:Domain of unknown function (DUF4326)